MSENVRPRATFRDYLPDGTILAATDWRRRHLGVVGLVWAHVVGLGIFGLSRGEAPSHVLMEISFIALFAIAASWSRFGRRARSAIACAGLITSSAILVHFWGGTIEGHFHFFVMLGVIALYQDWLPYALSILYVLLHHGTVGVLDAASVYNHASALANPWKWAAIHAVFVAGLSVAHVAGWRIGQLAQAERQAAEAEKERSLSTLAATLESTADGILVIDKEGRIANHNERFARMWNIPREVLESRDDQKAIACVLGQLRDPEAFLARVQALYAQPEGESFDILEFKDGREFERYSRPLRLNGESVGRVWSFRDVTERRLAEQERARNLASMSEVDHLRELDSFRSQFINSAAHELKTPLTPIRVQLHLLEQGAAPLTERQQKALQMLKRNFGRFDRLVQDLVSSARMQTDRLGIRHDEADLARILTNAIETYRPTAAEARIRLDASVPGPVPIRADVERLGQVLYNLIGNAIKFTPAGGRIHVTLHTTPEEAIVGITDTGPGLTSEKIAKLFQPFSQVHEDVTHRGSGLGLYISRGIVELHGGRMWCESDGPGHGSTFAFALPLQGPLLAPLAEPSAPDATRQA